MFADKFSKHMKWFLLALFILGGGCFLVFTLSLVSIVPDLKVILYISYIMGNVIMYSTIPLFFETACEVTYPVAEGVTNLVLTLANNIAGLIFLLIQMIPHIGTMWENWALLGSIFVCVPVLLLLQENYNRLTVDESSKQVPVDVDINEKQSET